MLSIRSSSSNAPYLWRIVLSKFISRAFYSIIPPSLYPKILNNAIIELVRAFTATFVVGYTASARVGGAADLHILVGSAGGDGVDTGCAPAR